MNWVLGSQFAEEIRLRIRQEADDLVESRGWLAGLRAVFGQVVGDVGHARRHVDEDEDPGSLFGFFPRLHGRQEKDAGEDQIHDRPQGTSATAHGQAIEHISRLYCQMT